MRLSKEAYNYHKVESCESCEHFEQDYDYYYEGTCKILHDNVESNRVCDAYESDEEEDSIDLGTGY